MNILSRLKLRTKLALLLGLSALALVVSIGVAASVMRTRMVDDRVAKLTAIVQSVRGLATALEAKVAARHMTRAEAEAQLREDIHAMRFDSGAGYAVAESDDGIVMMHGTNPSLEGKPSPVDPSTGKSFAVLALEALRNGDDGVISYMFHKPGQTQPLGKLSAVARFAPWRLHFVAGAYIDDLDADFRAAVLRLGGIGGLVLLVTLAVAWLINRDISGSLGRLKAAMERLATGDLTTAIPGTARRDEIGGMASAVLVFKEHMQKEQEHAAAREQERERAAAEKSAALVGMADRIETETATALQVIAERTAAMAGTAEAMRASAARTGEAAHSAQAASTQALGNAQTVASAAEQLSASIREIGGQMAQSTEVVRRAVAAGAETRATIEALNERVGQIGAVADMIGEIAARTNLLALNATIEAARAGDAGKGFAVVASEVKTLATQTARSTQEIAQHIAEVRSATGASVAAVGRIEQSIDAVNAIAGSIAAAVEQQGAATAEIARSVSETASAANVMTSRTNEVSAEAGQTGSQAAAVHEHAVRLDGAIEDLRRAVIRVVRTSTTEVDRRLTARRAVDLPARLRVPGQSESGGRVVDISQGGAKVLGGPALPPGTSGTLQLAAAGLALPFRVQAAESGALHMAFDLDAKLAARLTALLETQDQRKAA
jgi:methyl-accepting chemotaxis protein